MPDDRALDQAVRSRAPRWADRSRCGGGLGCYAADVERARRALIAPGVTTLVAIVDGRVVGAIQLQSDGLIQARVSMLLIDRKWRGRRLGSRLLREGLERAGGLWLDVRTRTEGYYERFGASRSLGFRLTREDLGLGGTAGN
jgi:ribosomal protein S18 acetylase RimI-like enzyme